MRVMIVDDERFFRDLYADHLADTGWAVETYATAEEAIARYEQGGIDLVVTDLVMPGTDGLALVAALRDRDPDVPIVVVTQREDVRSAVEALRLGVNEYLVKPVDREMLILAAERAFEQTGLARAHRKLEAEHLEHLRSEAVYLGCLQLLSILDTERLCTEIPSALAGLTGGQGGALWHGGADERRPFRLQGFSGVVDERSVPEVLDLSSDAPRDRRLLQLATYTEGGAALWVPLVSEGRLIGVVMVADKLSGAFDEQDTSLARTVGDFAGTALRNALRVGQLQRAGLRDRETAAYNITYFIDYAGKEIYKARRYGRIFSLVAIQVENLAVMKRALPAETTRTVHRALIAAVQKVVRDSDILAKVTEDTFYLLLPETDYFGALMFMRRAMAGFDRSELIRSLSVPPSVVAGAASYPKDGQDFDELLECCRARQEEVRASPYRRLHLQEHDFWELVDTLLTTPAEAVGTGPAGRRGHLPLGLVESVQREIASELQRRPEARGLLYFGTRRIDASLTLLRELNPAREGATRVYLLGQEVRAGLDHPSVTAVQLPAERRLERYSFLIYLTEHAAYAWLRDEESEQAYHSSDSPLVEALVARLQEAYDLQRHLST
ncbi:MAG: response regulator [Deltaproteobacteria bacterium]|nr:MAG: response regulator [Deltaproteobacteria bacterium]